MGGEEEEKGQGKPWLDDGEFKDLVEENACLYSRKINPKSHGGRRDDSARTFSYHQTATTVKKWAS